MAEDNKNPKPTAAQDAALKKAEAKAAKKGKKIEKRKPGLYVSDGKSITNGKRVLDEGSLIKEGTFDKTAVKRLMVLGCIEEQS